MLDGSVATLRALPEIVDAVGDEIEVLMDGGVRRGTDVVKAVALGARAVLLGRAYVYPLLAAGEPGVRRISSSSTSRSTRRSPSSGVESVHDSTRRSSTCPPAGPTPAGAVRRADQLIERSRHPDSTDYERRDDMTIDNLSGGALIGAAIGTWLAPLSSMMLALYGAVLGAAIGSLAGLIRARRNGRHS